MRVLHKLVITVVFTLEIMITCLGKAQTDHCSDDSDTYSYTAVIKRNQNWYAANTTCVTRYHGCLAQPKNKTDLKRIKNSISTNQVHGSVIYWVGLKISSSGKLLWANGHNVTINDRIRNIVNFSTPKTGVDFCFAATTASKLQPMDDCTSGTKKFVCQIPNTKIPTQQPPTTKTKKPKKSKTPATTNTKKPPKTTRKTPRLKTFVDIQVDKYIVNANKMKVDDKNSINAMLKLISALMRGLKSAKKKGKGRVMKAALIMEKFAMKYANRYLRSSNVTRMLNKSDGMVFEMRRVSIKQRIVFPHKNDLSEGRGRKTTIELPDSIFEGQDVMIVNSLFTEVTDFIPLTRDNDSRQKEIISPVISSTLDPKPQDVLKENVTIVLEHFKQTSSKAKPTCVFWDTSVDNDLGGEWSAGGCTAVKSNETRTVCSCNHLTSFALLMQVDDTPKKETNSTNQVVLSYITYIGCTLSLIGEALTVLAYVVFMSMNQEQSQIRVNLAISLAMAQIFFLSGITATSNLGVCTFVAVMLHYFYLVAFGWMMLEGVYLYLMVVKVFNTVIKMKLYYIFAWGFPLPFVIIPLIVASTLTEDGIDSYTNQNFCWVSFSDGLIWTFVGPVILISLANMFILVCSIREIVKLNHDKLNQAETFRQGVKACVVLFPLLGLTWLFGLLSVTDAGIVFQYIFTILNSFQGFLIFVLHCLRSGEIRSSIKHKLQRWEISMTNTFASSRSTVDNSASSTTDNNQHKHKPEISATDSSVYEGLTKHNRIEPISS